MGENARLQTRHDAEESKLDMKLDVPPPPVAGRTPFV